MLKDGFVKYVQRDCNESSLQKITEFGNINGGGELVIRLKSRKRLVIPLDGVFSLDSANIEDELQGSSSSSSSSRLEQRARKENRDYVGRRLNVSSLLFGSLTAWYKYCIFARTHLEIFFGRSTNEIFIHLNSLSDICYPRRAFGPNNKSRRRHLSPSFDKARHRSKIKRGGGTNRTAKVRYKGEEKNWANAERIKSQPVIKSLISFTNRTFVLLVGSSLDERTENLRILL
uniref:Uncharacterized protein n=1 Tax=Vespula pensylvanica TaxID=30213 RepID=A0A834KMJ2_VESPE|nr:hypothetical protein H0235_013286 [Vespula pensylvanica]